MTSKAPEPQERSFLTESKRFADVPVSTFKMGGYRQLQR
jgi:hypothetical protein